MIRTLKITSIIVIIAAFVLITALVILALKPDPEITQYLQTKTALEKFRETTDSSAEDTSDQVSPLVSQAESFSLRLDPPPPPTPVRTDPQSPSRQPQQQSVQPQVPARPSTLTARFSVKATLIYPQKPEKSLVMLDTPGAGSKWYRPGEQVGHALIEEISDGAVTYSINGAKSTAYAPAPQDNYKLRVLDPDQPGRAYSPSAGEPGADRDIPPELKALMDMARQETAELQEKGINPASQPARSGEQGPSISPQPVNTAPLKPQQQPAANVPHRTRTRPRPEQMQEQVDNSIQSVQKLIESEKQNPADDDGTEALQKLLEILQKEKEGLENQPDAATEDPKRQ